MLSVDAGIPLTRVVAVVATLPCGQQQVGSGYLVGGRQVLTAAHCTHDKKTGAGPREIRVTRADDGASAVVTEVIPAPLEDVAVLQLTDAPWEPDLPAPVFARVHRAHSGVLRDCTAIGYPLFQRDPTRRAWYTAELHGIINQTDGHETGKLLMRVLEEPGLPEPGAGGGMGTVDKVWDGLSGALVFHAGQAIGVILEHHQRQGFTAVQLAAFDTIRQHAETDQAVQRVSNALALPTGQLVWATAEPKPPTGLPPLHQAPPPSAVFDPGQVVDVLVYRLLAGSFLALPVLQGTPARWLCRELRVRRGSTDTCTPPTLAFHFEVQKSQTRQPELQVSFPSISRWRGLVETQPVVIILVSEPHLGVREKFWMLCFHDWLIQNAATTPTPSRRSSSDIPVRGFQQIDNEGENLHRLLIREAERARGMDGAKWRTLRDYRLIPVDEETFLEFLDLARALEVPTEVYKKLAMRSRGQLTRSLRQYLQQGGSDDDPLVQEWLASIDGIPVPTGLDGFDRRQFRRFTRLVNQSGQGVQLPRYRGLEVGCWRTFVSMYPEALTGLHQIIATSRHGNDVAFAAAMLPMLALSNDPIVERRAHEALGALSSRAQDFSSYRVRRELLRAPAEAGVPDHIDKLIDLMRREGAHGMERRFLSDYGWTAQVVEQNINRKIDSPTLRDVNLKGFYEAMGDVIVNPR